MGLKRLCLFTLAVVLYTILMILYFQNKLRTPAAGRYKVFPRKLIVLVSQPRSGSTYLGNVISKTIKSIYFYEPLYKLDSMLKIDLDVAGEEQRRSYDVASGEYLRHVFHCNFNDRDSWQKIFKSPFKSLSTLSGNDCNDNNERLKYRPNTTQNTEEVVIPGVSRNGGRSYTLNRCMPFLNANHLQKECQTMNLMVKLLELRLPHSDMLNLEQIIDNGIQYKIIYLVRDPRAAFYSLLKTEWVVKTIKDPKFQKYVTMRCQEMSQNIKQVHNTQHTVIVR